MNNVNSVWQNKLNKLRWYILEEPWIILLDLNYVLLHNTRSKHLLRKKLYRQIKITANNWEKKYLYNYVCIF